MKRNEPEGNVQFVGSFPGSGPQKFAQTLAERLRLSFERVPKNEPSGKSDDTYPGELKISRERLGFVAMR